MEFSVVPQEAATTQEPASSAVAHAPDLGSYDQIIVGFSGGKDSLACVLHLLELGVPAEKIMLHHHLVDGREGSTLMDWPCTEGYVHAIAQELGMELTLSWREGGFEREMCRNDSATAPVIIPGPDGYQRVGGKGPQGTRLKFPQVSASLSQRWCSAALKIDPFDRWLTNDSRFRGGRRTLVVTGERAQESSARSNYKAFEPHRSDLRRARKAERARHIDHWRCVHQWSEQQVWAIIERHLLLPHPAYWLGWGRTSCRCCVFGSKHQWATIRQIAPQQLNTVANYEREFGVTIHRKLSVMQLADAGTPYNTPAHWVEIANSRVFNTPVRVQHWQLPQGAYGESCGPT